MWGARTRSEVETHLSLFFFSTPVVDTPLPPFINMRPLRTRPPTTRCAAAPANSAVGRDGKAVRGPSLEVTLPSGLKLPNPFVIGE